MTLNELFESLIAELVDADSHDVDVLLVMYLLHTHLVRTRPGVVLKGVHDASTLWPLTKADVAEMVGKRLGPGRSTEGFWLREYARRTPYESHSELPRSLRSRAEQLRQKASSNSFVLDLVPED